ncbi:Zinc finger CCCH domain-containing protein 7 [Apostasia shenzhenica]|uniref:Zinc finger CCCH domain-containing protein 7 n=1 Tax=Apostasia shenzhenica TaxID=1088818 RepID=A0A2I0AP24_9ASPA|nr:Zinc finger CCCH domain-containing protein 7 [Apostasia shenzhenica]
MKEMDLETLSSEGRRCSSFSSVKPFTRCRRHLDSASYRSLVRIFSHCLDLSLVSSELQPKGSNSEPEDSLSGKDPPSGAVGADLPGECFPDEGKKGTEGFADGAGKEGVAAAGANLVDLDIDIFDPLMEKEIEKRVSSELLSSLMSDCSRLLDAPEADPCLRGESQEGKGIDGHDEEGEWKVKQANVDGLSERIRHTSEISAFGNEHEVGELPPNVFRENLDSGNRGAEELGELPSSKTVDDTGTEKPVLDEGRDGGSNAVEEEESRKQQTDDEDFEEGEIPDDVQDLSDSENNVSGGTVLEDRKKDGMKEKDINDIASCLTVPDKDEEIKHLTFVKLPAVVLSGNDFDYKAGLPNTAEDDLKDMAVQSMQKVVKVREKRKHAPPTDERKFKKKLAKKRKRAQKNKELGVKKLKLHPVLKPKEVKPCNFHLKGRCQQGDLCKFSHDATPLTKSMPCKYFACNSCLKGDDCPFDHELSKYSCHNYISTGSCSRGDKCKFSHKIATTGASSQALLADNICSLLTSETTSSKNNFVKKNVSLSATPQGTKVTPPIMHKPLNEITRVPKGISFLSFGATKTNSPCKLTTHVNKPGHMEVHNQKQQDMGFSMSACHNSSNLTMKVLETIKGSSVSSSGGTLSHEVSEATKILEEFLFGQH